MDAPRASLNPASSETRVDEPKAQLEKKTSPSAQNTSEQYPKGLRLALIFVGLFLAVLCVGLDRLIISTAVPKITTEFNSLLDVGWYGSAYFLPSCSFQLMFGKFYAGFNTKWVFLAALVLFEVGSVICATAPSSTVLIAGRAIAGTGSAGVLTGALIMLGTMTPIRQRPKFLGALGSAMGFSQVVAPTIGGSLADYASWRWCFWINLPVGAVTIAAVLLFSHQPSRQTSDGAMPMTLNRLVEILDLLGTVVFLPTVICLLLALQWGGTEYPWNDWRIILLLCIFSVGTVAWAVIQYFEKDKATLPPRIIRQRSIAAIMWYMVCVMGLMVVIIYYIPLWFQAVLGVSAYQSGINNLTNTLSMAVTAIAAGFVASKIGYYVPLLLTSTCITSVAVGLISRFDTDTTTGYWVGSLLLFGIGVGSGAQQSMVVPQVVLKGSDMALGTSAIVFVQTLSGTIFLSIGQSIFQGQLISELHWRAPRVDPQVVIDSGAADLAQSMQRLYPGDVRGIIEAYAGALRAIFMIPVVLSCLSIFGSGLCEWKSVKKGEKEIIAEGQKEVSNREKSGDGSASEEEGKV